MWHVINPRPHKNKLGAIGTYIIPKYQGNYVLSNALYLSSMAHLPSFAVIMSAIGVSISSKPIVVD